LDTTCGLLWDSVRVSAQFIAGLSAEARAFILGANPPLSAESDPLALTAAAEAGDIGRRNRVALPSRPMSSRGALPSLAVTSTSEDAVISEYVADQGALADLEHPILVAEAAKTGGTSTAESVFFLCWQFGHFLKECTLLPKSVLADIADRRTQVLRK
jgi:hypothetical protein